MALSDNLEAYYSLEDTSDATGNGYTLTNSGSVAFEAAKIGNGANFANTTTKKLSTTSIFGLNSTSPFSISMWIKVVSETTNDNEIFLVQDNGGASVGWYFRGLYEHNGGSKRLRFFRLGSGVAFLDIAGSIGDNTFRHIVFTYNGSGTGALNLYLNAGTPVTGTNTGTTTISSTEGFSIGNSVNAGAPGNKFNGFIDEVGIWNRELTSSEVSQLYNSGAGLSYADITGGGGVVKPNFLGFGGI